MFAGASDELATRHACSDPRFDDAQCRRNYVKTYRGLDIGMLTESATNELEDMEGERACRCNSFAQQQAVRVCVGPDMIWLDFVSRRPLRLEDGETTTIATVVAGDSENNVSPDRIASVWSTPNKRAMRIIVVCEVIIYASLCRLGARRSSQRRSASVASALPIAGAPPAAPRVGI